MNRKGIYFKNVARIMFLIMGIELVSPAVKTYALTSGPTQPEVHGFEPVGTTDMVDQFSGDFVYNIPLLDVDGYPINISYHSGIGVEDEASWVGLGWNINPGAINRSVRGLPDDFKGDKLYKKLKIKSEKELRFKLGIGLEIAGAEGGKPNGYGVSLNLGSYLSYNNYKGVGLGFSVGAGFRTPVVSAGLGVAVSSLEGADVDVYANMAFKSSSDLGSNQAGLSAGTGFNTRSGLKALSYGIFVGQVDNRKAGKMTHGAGLRSGISMGSYIPIGMQNYVASMTNETNFKSWEFTAKFGAEIALLYLNLTGAIYGSELSYNPEGTLPSFGFMYMQDAVNKGIVDFSREKDGIYNATLPNLPMSNMTYDVYTVSGQGTGGMFRPFRSDLGTTYDPELKTASTSTNAGVEVGVGNGFEIGANLAYYENKIEVGPLKRALFQPNMPNSLFENVYFKQAGELTNGLPQGNMAIGSHAPVRVDQGLNMFGKTQAYGALPAKYTAEGNDYPRATRATSISTLTNEQLGTKHSTQSTSKRNIYPRNVFYDNNTAIGTDAITRVNTQKDKSQAHHIGEITQLQPDGRTYVYGLPIMNNLQKEVTIKIADPGANTAAYQTGLVSLPESYSNDDYTQITVTPAHAHSYMLTAVLSADYVDITGDGVTDDDLGDYVKFNYTQTSANYFWRSPYTEDANTSFSAQFNPGFYSDIQDDKASYISGSKEIWYLHSVETKNNIAEFTISERLDGKGVLNAPLKSTDFESSANYDEFSTGSKNPSTERKLYKLDNIKLYSKADRYVNKANALPIKSVFFDYDYSLCGGTPNSDAPGKKKLTLKRVYFKNGNSDKSLLNPYVFDYNEQNNYTYDYAAKDRWGNYKPNNPDHSNFENPYVEQDKAKADQYAAAWLLNKIKLPSGGELNINYESDDYSYVQDKDATEMVNVVGVGQSKAFEPKDVLYDGDQIYNYVYFKIDRTRLDGQDMEANYFRDNPERLLYFSFLVDLPARNRFEVIKGYAKVEEVGYCGGEVVSDYGYFKLKNERMGQSSNKPIHPVSLGALNIGRYHLPHVLYPGSTVQYENSNNSEVFKGLKDAWQSLISLGKNINQSFIDKGMARTFKPQKSWIRTSTPGYTKLGGGSRVKSLQVSDKWNTMATNGENSAVGKYYDYSILNAAGKRISSGVASNEPMIGGEENPLRKPINYTGDKGRLLPPIQLFQEGPIGESFYPGASVGYSQVSVTSIHKDEGRASKALDVTQFYTAKDFPIRVDNTIINKDISRSKNTLLHKMEDIGVSQGYALYLNDMHGKLKSISNYLLKGENEKELITSAKYNYKTDQNGRLDNQVKAVVRQAFGGSGIDYAVKTVTLGEDVDYTVDNRQRFMSSVAADVKINLNVAFIGPFPLTVPAVFSPPRTEESWFRTTTATKIIQQYGIVTSVEHYDHGAKTILHNVLYDGTSGQVLLTKTTNDYNDPVSNLNFPVHWYKEQMGPAYMNLGYEEVVENFNVDSTYAGKLSGIDDVNRFWLGDELLLTIKNSSGTEVYNNRVWVMSAGSGQLVVLPSAKFINGNVSTPWLPQSASYTNVKVRVLRSGRRNRLMESMQQYAFKGEYNATDFTNLFEFLPADLLTASTVIYDDNTENRYNAMSIFPASYAYNDYIKGLKGNFKPQTVYSYLEKRKYDNQHSRTDGTYSAQSLFTYLPLSNIFGGASYLFNYDPGFPGKWHVLKRMTYDNSGNMIEESDASGKVGSVLNGFQNNLPVAVADNAQLSAIMYHNFDDLFMLYHKNSAHLGQTATFNTTEPLSFLYNSNGQSYGVYSYTPSIVVYGNTYNVVPEAHTGKYGLKSTSAIYRLPMYTTQLFNALSTTNLYFSMWVKPPAGTALNASAFKVNGTYPFTATTKAIEGWYKVECHVSNIGNGVNMTVHIPENYIVDDVRLCPEEANMNTYTYDPVTRRLLAQMDENNFATFYEYDAEGRLVRTKKETDKGILTLTESRLSNKK